MAQKNGRMARRVLVSTLSLLFGTAAHAGFYPGHIDPGGNGTDIPGFTGDVVFNIPDSCIHSDGSGWQATDNNVGASLGCGSASVVSGTINLYSVATTEPAFPGQVLGQFSLAETWDVLGVLSANGVLLGIDTNAMGPEIGTAFGDHDDWEGDSFWLQFVSGACPADDGCTPPGQFFADPAFISITDINNFSPPGTVTFGRECQSADPCFVTAAVPEPGTLALLFGALGGGWLGLRRKRNTAA